MATTTSTTDGLTLRAYAGDRSALLAFDLDAGRTERLAGFAISALSPSNKQRVLPNRLSFGDPITHAITPSQRKWTPSNEAPFQKFRWLDFPPSIEAGEYTYHGTAMYFTPEGGLTEGPSTSVSLPLQPDVKSHFELAFTRGYISSQAYAAEFHNEPIGPKNPSLDFDASPYRDRWAWAGAHAREAIFRFLDEVRKSESLRLDCFAYDLDEPEFVKGLEALGNRLRVFIDDSARHAQPRRPEHVAAGRLRSTAGSSNVRIGRFSRFQHNKVLIQRSNGKPVKVLTGSANFSLRGLYAQANNVMVLANDQVARLFADAFDAAFNDPKTSRGSKSFATSDPARGGLTSAE